MVNWKDPASNQRLMAASVAANTSRPDYKLIATYFGQGATYDAIEKRYRQLNKMADQLHAEANKEGRLAAASRATRTPRDKNRVAKPSTPLSSSKSKGKGKKALSNNNNNNGLIQSIFTEDNGDNGNDNAGPQVKVKPEDEDVLPSIEDDADTKPVVPKQEDVFTSASSKNYESSSSIFRSRRSAAPMDSDSDEYMASPGSSRTPKNARGRPRTRPSRASAAPRQSYADRLQASDNEEETA
ncbi:hypothetical protein BDW74DRAFT_176209 [Aspergillus multicolor]|uniref:uncharacterized protein n=1 Tax=Aspergillus multicolor TaxID=41759 RepID=UPI003CCDF665